MMTPSAEECNAGHTVSNLYTWVGELFCLFLDNSQISSHMEMATELA